MSYLILARHGESEFNAKSLWTGIWDMPLTEKGRHEATLMAGVIADIKPDVAFTSALIRAKDTLSIILKTNNWVGIPVHAHRTLNERDYGQLTGMNKWDVEKQYGVEQFQKWRRGWNEPVPAGETLKMVSERALPYFQTHIIPELTQNHNVLVTSHGNTLRALIKHLDKLSDQAVQDLEMPFGVVIIYTFNSQGAVTGKTVRKIDTIAAPA